MKEVTKEVFYDKVGNLDTIIVMRDGNWPYECIYKMRHGNAMVGKVVPSSDSIEASLGEGNQYFIA